jgi:hypothetical protein
VGWKTDKAGWLTEVGQAGGKKIGWAVRCRKPKKSLPIGVCITPFADHKPRSGHARMGKKTLLRLYYNNIIPARRRESRLPFCDDKSV